MPLTLQVSQVNALKIQLMVVISGTKMWKWN